MISEVLRKHQAEYNLSNREMALKLNISPSYYSRLLSGQRQAGRKVLVGVNSDQTLMLAIIRDIMGETKSSPWEILKRFLWVR